ncbi:glycosyltransferase [Gloeocapsopsis crepidinum LEGE 06123]|uniref:Glycosyltransferase n=1 Tax=Gloeocapsopsis crepidinum LEGE 06123 TaxID=588587 RepID=A0ABR9UR76_9CHRO|nr:glycosyltransferase [Gloeocapsopsis crepidinum]MBE9190772.1 glycosyltransferase [Gloeocapsopsis crepidinum LEGE 06123]
MNSQVTIVVVPRERFSYTRESLESIYAHTKFPFELVYVDGGSPAHIESYLKQQAEEKNFKLIRSDRYLSPNQARNLGIPAVNSKYTVFVDNDVIVTPGWLTRLVQCAEETEAAVVAPLVCIGQPDAGIVHLAGGEARIELQEREKNGKTKTRRRVHEKHYFVNRRLDDVRNQLQRIQCEFAEFHCVLVQTDVFTKTGLLDEKLLSTREHIDFSMTVAQAGGKIYCEPASIVTYVPGPPFELTDMPFFMLRWSDAWELASLKHFREKWDVTEDKYFQKRYERLGERRYQAFLKPFIRRFSFGRQNYWLVQKIVPLERKLNRYISDRYQQKLGVSN